MKEILVFVAVITICSGNIMSFSMGKDGDNSVLGTGETPSTFLDGTEKNPEVIKDKAASVYIERQLNKNNGDVNNNNIGSFVISNPSVARCQSN